MHLTEFLILISGLSFLGYGISYFTSSHMKSEFLRYGLAKYGMLTAVLEIFGAIGLLLGLRMNILLLISSAGLALLMLLGLIVRIRIKDSFRASFPALFFLLLNAYILGYAISVCLD